MCNLEMYFVILYLFFHVVLDTALMLEGLNDLSLHFYVLVLNWAMDHCHILYVTQMILVFFQKTMYCNIDSMSFNITKYLSIVFHIQPRITGIMHTVISLPSVILLPYFFNLKALARSIG